MSKACPNHGPIDWPLTTLTCPACGEELEAYDNDLLLGLVMPPVGSGVSGLGSARDTPDPRPQTLSEDR